MNCQQPYDVIVVGGGHAGCEAALASCRMGARVLLLTGSIEKIAAMSCNPAIGGLAKGNLVKDIDALGGEMARNIDASCIQFNVLNQRKGVAARSSRAQADKKIYSERMIAVLADIPNLRLKQALAGEIIVRNGEALGIYTLCGQEFIGKKVILCPGTFLKGKIFIGGSCISGGRMYEPASKELADSLSGFGFREIRLKTGTPARLHADSINYSKLEKYETAGDRVPFSFENSGFILPQVSCYSAYTNEETHRVVRENLSRSLYYSSADKGVGPRYCPSMEDKVTKFPNRERHQVILEPEGLSSKEIYPNGFSTSLPADVQLKAYRTIAGLENCEFIRPAYAIEYAAYDPRDLKQSYETRLIKGLYFAGQINGTSGYEEAAAQGFMAGVNATLSISGSEPLILRRDESYIGVLTDDLVTKGVDEPYRMFSSRSEYRLLLREDNSEYRLIEYGKTLGLISDERYRRFKNEKEIVEGEIERLKTLPVRSDYKSKTLLSSMGINLNRGQSAYDFLKRPESSYEALRLLGLGKLEGRPASQVEIAVRYADYIDRQKEDVLKFKRLENRSIGSGFDYEKVAGLRREYVEKLSRIKPATLGQALRIPGMSLSAIAILDVALAKAERR